MKRFIAIFFFALMGTLPLLAENPSTNSNSFPSDSVPDIKKNIIMIAPLGHLLNGSKSSVYYKRILNEGGRTQLMLRAGTEGFGSFFSRFSTRVSKVDVFNLKVGLEAEVDIGSVRLFFGPEISQTRYRTEEGQMRVRESNTLFNTSTIALNSDVAVDNSQVRMTSGHLFFGFKVDISPTVLFGVEMAGGYGQFDVETELADTGNTITSSGDRWDFNFARFIFAEFYF